MKKLCLLAILFVIMGVYAYSQEPLSLDKAVFSSPDKQEAVGFSSENNQVFSAQKKLFELSVGLGGFCNYIFINSYESAWMDYGMFGNINAEIFSSVLLDVSFKYFWKNFISAEEVANCLEMDISLFWKCPSQITRSLSLFSLFGISYEMMFYMKDDAGVEYNREEAKDLDAAYLKIGGGFDYYFSRHFRFNLNLLYGASIKFSVIKVGDYTGPDLGFYFLHGPSLSTSIRYVF
jgi:hypothetical protein